jgi:integrase
VLQYTENTAPFVLTQSECNRLSKVCADASKNAAIIELLIQTGITLSELVRLTMDDIQLGDKGQGFMRMEGSRGRKGRIIPLVPRKGKNRGSQHTEVLLKSNMLNWVRNYPVQWTINGPSGSGLVLLS